MKHLLLPMAALAIVAASCSTHTGDSYTSINFGEVNLVIDNDNPEAAATVTPSYYYAKMNWSKGTAEISTLDLVVDGKKASFETNQMPLSVYSVKDPYSEYYVQQGSFSSKENIGKGATVTDLAAVYTSGVYNVALSVPGFSSLESASVRLILGYTLDNRFRVKTFWPDCYYVGKTDVYGGGTSFTTNSTYYRVVLDFSKNTAKVVLCFPKYAEVEKETTEAIVLTELPIIVSHDTYAIVAESPKTQIMVTEKGKTELKDSDKYKVSDFRLSLSSDDMTEASIIYTINENEVVFNGCSIVKKKD